MDTPPPCQCGRGPAWWAFFKPPVCFTCALQKYEELAPGLQAEQWIQMAEQIAQLARRPEWNTGIPDATLLAFLDQLQCILGGIRRQL